MSEEAGKAFQRVLKRKKTGKGIVIDGYRNFLFLNQKGMPMTACYYTSTLRNIVKKYNKYHDEPLPTKVDGNGGKYEKNKILNYNIINN